MDDWMGRLMDGWMEGGREGGMDGQMDRQTHGWMADGQMDG